MIRGQGIEPCAVWDPQQVDYWGRNSASERTTLHYIYLTQRGKPRLQQSLEIERTPLALQSYTLSTRQSTILGKIVAPKENNAGHLLMT